MTDSKPASRLSPVLVVAILVGLAGLGYYFVAGRWQPAKQSPAVPTVPAALAPAEPRYPLPTATDAPTPALPALPALYESDPDLLTALALLFEDDALWTLLVREHLIERFVASVDNLPSRRITANVLPLKPLGGSFRVEETGQSVILAAENSERYRAAVGALTRIDPAALVQLYRRWYPLFQQAYRELGYPDRYFNDRLVEVIEHLLAAPEAGAAIALVAVNGRFQFADPALESASVGHKAMLRMGRESSDQVKTWLAAVRALLIAPIAIEASVSEEPTIP